MVQTDHEQLATKALSALGKFLRNSAQQQSSFDAIVSSSKRVNASSICCCYSSYGPEFTQGSKYCTVLLQGGRATLQKLFTEEALLPRALRQKILDLIGDLSSSRLQQEPVSTGCAMGPLRRLACMLMCSCALGRQSGRLDNSRGGLDCGACCNSLGRGHCSCRRQSFWRRW